jgi:hypothetical protein
MLMLMRLESLLLLLIGMNHLAPKSIILLVVAAANNENTNCSTISEIVCQTEGFGTSTCSHDIPLGDIMHWCHCHSILSFILVFLLAVVLVVVVDMLV